MIVSRTYGKICYRDERWRILTEPHVRSTIKRIFPSMDKQTERELWCSNTAGNAETLLWIMERYPMEISDHHRRLMDNTAAMAEEQRKLAGEIFSGHTPEPSVLGVKLRSYQERSVQLVLALRGLICADDLGLGKTLVGIGLLSHQIARPAVVVCPQHLQRQWRDSIQRFLPQAKPWIAPTGTPEIFAGDILITTYSKLKGWVSTLSGKVKTVIFDEGQELRHTGTDKYVAAFEVAMDATFKLILTATPVTNYAGEVFNLCQIVRNGELGEPHEFQKEWCSHTTNSGQWVVEEPQALGGRLRELAIMVRHTRAEVGRELPPLTQYTEEVPYSPHVLNALKEDALQLAEKILHGTFQEKGQASRELSLKLRQATGVAKAPYVAAFINELTQKGLKVLVGVWHREVYAILQAKLTQPSFMYSGSESVSQKQKAKDAFLACEGGASFLMSTKSGAGLDGLQEQVAVVVFAELDWSGKIHEQFIGRAHRDGQENPVQAFYLVADAGSDPVVAQILGLKFEQGVGVLDHEIDMDTIKGNAVLSSNVNEQETSNAVQLATAFVNKHRKPKDNEQPTAA